MTLVRVEPVDANAPSDACVPAAWMNYHDTMVTTPGSPIDIARLRKQLADEDKRLSDFRQKGQKRGQCDSFACCAAV